MKPFSALLCLAVLSLLSACGPPQPQYRTDYIIVPPKNQMGGMCANNCLGAQQNCQQSCALQKQACVQNNQFAQQAARDDAERDYRDYVRQRKAEGKLIKRDRDSFYRTPYVNCDVGACVAQCTSTYHICHTNCGGEVRTNTYCYANCDVPIQMPQPGMQ